MTEASVYEGALDRGLEGVVACSTAISTIAGTTLLYRGYTIEDLAAHATFEEVVYQNNRIYRPRGNYVGPRDRHYMPIEER